MRQSSRSQKHRRIFQGTEPAVVTGIIDTERHLCTQFSAQMEVRMKFVSVRDLRGNSARIWQELPVEKEMVITSNGRPIAILAAVNESNLEEALSAFRTARAVEAVAQLQQRSLEHGTDQITIAEIEAEIKTVRSKRTR